jgi:GT2 family glycosyltransferase/glycosyltransferase involved in cell wall biosynthesis
MYLIDVLRPRVFVELGVHAGDSYCAFCQAVKELQLDTRCYGVDTWQGDAHSGAYGADVLDGLRAHHDPLYGAFSSLIPGTFDDALPRFTDGTVDLLHIDGYHAYDAVKHDFESWLPKMSAGGIVLLHDIDVRERDFGIRRLWTEIKDRYPTVEFMHGHGLGLVAVPDEVLEIRNVFIQLGQRVSLQGDIEALRRQLDAARAEWAASIRLAPPPPVPLDGDEGRQRANVLQLFWDDGTGFSQARSVSAPLIADGEIHHYVLRLPPDARGLLRLDPGDRAAYMEIHRIELGAGHDGEDANREVVHRWSAAEADDGIVPARGLTRLSGDTTYRFVCTDDDPQLLLGGAPERDERPWAVRLTLRASERVVEVLADEISRLEREQARQHRWLLERDTDLERAGARLAQQEKAAHTLSARLAEHEQAFAAARASWRSERERLVDELTDQRRVAQSQSDELQRAGGRLEWLEARAVEQQRASRASRAESVRLSRRIDAHEHAIQSIAAEVEQRRQEVIETYRRLGEREHLLFRIGRSRGWKALNRYRQVKHRFLGPFRRIRDGWKTLVRGERQPSVEPINDLRRLHEAGVWESTGPDPQFNLGGPWPEGWAEISLHIEAPGAPTGRARLYVNRGAGYIEGESYDLGEVGVHRRHVVWLGPDVVSLRLDPFESAGCFEIMTLAVRRGSPRRAGSVEAGPAPAAAEGARAAAEPRAVDPYDAWLEVNEWSARRAALLGERLAAVTAPPLLSVVMPVYNPAPELLDKAIASVASQVYRNWELCIADDASTDPATRVTLQRWADREPRIRVVFRDVNGQVSRATNSAAGIAGGEFLVFLDQDDEITPDALGEVALYLAEHPETDVVYSDDDKIDAYGRRFAPQFKPDWSPELLLSYMYLSHLFVLRRSLFTDVGGLRVGYEGSQDYDLALRATEVGPRVGHIAKVLYHWRAVPGSTAVSGSAKPESFRAGMRAVQEALERRGARAVAHQPDWAAAAACGIFSHEFPDEGPRVAVIIPTKNHLAQLIACLDSLEATTYKNYEVVIVDNESDDAETLEFLRWTPHRVLRIASPPEGFSFAAINNRAVEETDADAVLFLNDDTEVLTPRWLSQMVGYLGLPGVGAVGARLRFPDGRLQHAGIVHGYYQGLAGPAFKLLPVADRGYLNYPVVARNYSAVTAACLLTPRDVFRRLGGFDARRFAVAYNDVDYCYRLRDAGLRVAYCPTAELIHREGSSRGFLDDPAEPAAFRKTYGGRRDPFYNPNLSLRDERFAVDARTLAPDRLPPIRTLMCAFNLHWEGAPYSQLELTVRLKEQGVIEPIVYCPEDGPLRAAYEARGIAVEVFEHPLRGALESAAYDAAVARFGEWISGLNVELVYGNTRQTFYAIDAAKRLGLPSIWNPRESESWLTYFDFLGPDVARRAQACAAYPYKVVFVSDATRQRCAEFETRHNFMTIHTGLDRDRFAATLGSRVAARHELGLAPNDVALLLVGTVCERKGQLDLIDAVARLDDAVANTVRCFVVGDRANDYSEQVNRAREALPAARRSRIEIVPATPDTGPYYAASDVFVCTARVESFPRVILEAMAAGLPIVTTPVYGIAEQVRENVNALWYAPSDTARLAAHIERLCREPDLRDRLARNSRHVLDTLNDFDAMAAEYGRVFREAWLSGKPH